MPKVAVIIQAWQDRGFIDECIESVKAQTFKDYDITLSSDGNSDLKQYADKHNIRFSLSSKRNHSASVNEAIKKTDSTWIKVIDDDDLIPENSLQDFWDNRGDSDLIQGNAMLFKEEGVHFYRGKPITIHSLLPLINNPINWASVFIKRSSFDSIGGFDDKVHFANDYDLYLNFLRNKLKIGYIDKTLGFYRLHIAQMSKMSTHFKVSEKIYLEEKYREYIYSIFASLVNDDMGCQR